VKLVVDPLEIVLPVSVFVDLIENDEGRRSIFAGKLFEKEGVFYEA